MATAAVLAIGVQAVNVQPSSAKAVEKGDTKGRHAYTEGDVKIIEVNTAALSATDQGYADQAIRVWNSAVGDRVKIKVNNNSSAYAFEYTTFPAESDWGSYAPSDCARPRESNGELYCYS